MKVMVRKKSDTAKPEGEPIKYIAMPRWWFLVLAAIMVATWILVAAAWLKPFDKHGAGSPNAAPARVVRAGKWGELTLTPIVISPPLELMLTNWGFSPRPTWFFPESNASAAVRMLQSAGVSASDAETLGRKAQPEPRISGVVIQPDPAWVRALAPDIRGRVYTMLARTWLNVDQTLAFRYPGTDLNAWLGSDLIAPQTRQLLEPLIYRDGPYMLFSDVALVRSEIRNNEEFRRLGKALCRQPTVIARVSVGNTANLDSLVEYWGRGNRRTEVRPLLESVAESGPARSVDVVNLLPPFARNHLYNYPKAAAGASEKARPTNCLWTSLNFFASDPDDRFLDDAVALKTLKEDYTVVQGDHGLGDIVAFLDERGNLFHAAVVIADDLAFSKSGASSMAPWTLMSLNDIKGFYGWRSENPQLVFHRRKGF